MKSPLPYIGGKSRLAKTIAGEIPDHTTYVEVFSGAAWVLFMKEESKVEVLNDLNSELVGFYRVLQYHVEEFCKQFKFLLSSREWFEDWDRQMLAGGLTDIQRAARYYYLQRHSFGGKVIGRTFGVHPDRGPRVNLIRMEEELSAVHLRLARVTIEHLAWQELLRRYDRPETFFYLDPPYFGFEKLYGKDLFHREDFEALASQLTAIKGKFLLSLNDVPEVRTLFKGFEIKEVRTSYSLRKVDSATHELLIRNY